MSSALCRIINATSAEFSKILSLNSRRFNNEFLLRLSWTLVNWELQRMISYIHIHLCVCVYNQINLLFLVKKQTNKHKNHSFFQDQWQELGWGNSIPDGCHFLSPPVIVFVLLESYWICGLGVASSRYSAGELTVSPGALKSIFPQIWCLEMSTAGKPPYLFPTKEQSALALPRTFLCV